MVGTVIERDPVERLAEEFAARCRAGEAPAVSWYIVRYPEHADQIRELFPAVAVMEQFHAVEKCRRETVFKQSAHARPPEAIGDFRILARSGAAGWGLSTRPSSSRCSGAWH